MKKNINTYKEFFLKESLNLDWEEIRYILDDMGSGEFSISNPEVLKKINGFYICGYPNQIEDPSKDDLETAKDRLDDIGLTLVATDIPSKYHDGISFLLVETELFLKLKSSGYKFLDDLDWKDWHMNKYMSSEIVFGYHTGGKKFDTKHSIQIIGDFEISILHGRTSPFEEDVDKYEFLVDEDALKIYSKTEAECLNIHLQQRERGSQKILKNFFN